MKGTVIKSTGSWYDVLHENEVVKCRIRGSFRIKGIKSTNPVAVGDRVGFHFEEGKGTGVITEIEERTNLLVRKSTNLSKQSHIIAANVDQVVLIASLVLPRTSEGFIDRILVSAESYRIPTIIVFNKMDLYGDDYKDELDHYKSMYENAGYKCIFTSAEKKQNLEELKNFLKDKTSLLTGHSGVGKSSLINAIDENLHLKVGDISTVHFKGKHTTTFAEMFPLSFGGYVIDSPGIKEFGLFEIEKEELSHYFPEFREHLNECRFNNCKHVNEPGCIIKEMVETGEIPESRYTSYLNILTSI